MTFTRVEKLLLLSIISFSITCTTLTIDMLSGSYIWNIIASLTLGMGLGFLIYALVFGYKQRGIRIVINDIIP